VDWIDLAQERNKQWALVNMVMKLEGCLTVHLPHEIM